MSVKDQIIYIIAEQALLEPADIAMSATLEDLGVDSMALVEAVFAIEEAFDIDIPYNANEPDASDFDLTSVASIIDGVTKLVSAKSA